MNPPFNVGQHNASPDPARRTAHVGSGETLNKWLAGAARLLDVDGVVTLIWRADALADVLAALARDFGGVSILPVYLKAWRGGDPCAGARHQRQPGAAHHAARLVACRWGQQADTAGRNHPARKCSTLDD